jgi:NAD+--dinitrogen-reductase ADP-D-ribosyltransferase
MGVYEYHRDFFEAIEKADTLLMANEIFDNYISELFELNYKIKGKKVGNIYKILMGCMFNSSGFEGAVLKGWVESRFGIIPNFHKTRIDHIESEGYYNYLSEKMSQRVNKNAIYLQLDLLYHYTQVVIKKFFPFYRPKLNLYRGIYNLEENEIIKWLNKKSAIMGHNNISSFTAVKNIAEQFGNRILRIEVPYTKIVFFSNVTPLHHFSGEQEFIVIGGEYLTEII